MSAPRLSLAYPRLWRPNTVPTFPVELDKAHPMARGLALSIVPGSSRGAVDFVSGLAPVVTGSPSFANTPIGRGLLPNGGVLGYPFAAAPVAFSYEVYVQAYASLAGAESILAFNQAVDATSGTFDREIAGDSGNNYILVTFPGGKSSEAGTHYQNSQIAHLVFTNDGTNVAIYVNGTLSATTALGAAYGGYSSPVYLVIGNSQSGKQGWRGQIMLVNMASVVWTAGEVAARYTEPFGMFRPIVRRTYFVGTAGGITVALTQQAATGTIGSVAKSTAVGIAQVFATAAVGSTAATQARPLTQVAATGASGALSPSASAALAQVTAAGSIGTITASTNSSVTVTLTQVSATGTTGAVAPGQAVPLTQVAATGTVGTIAPSRSAVLPQTAATATAGTAAPGDSIGLTQAAGTGTVGSVTATAGSNVTVALSQVSAAGAVGTITASTPVTVSLSQAVAAGAIGALASSRSAGLAQAAAAGTVGIITAVSGVTAALSQVAATGAVGTIAWARALGLSQTLAVGVVGTIRVGGVTPPDHRRVVVSAIGIRSIRSATGSRAIGS